MRTRIPAGTLKRLEAVEQARGQRKYVAMFPRLVTVEEWGPLAERMQCELKMNVKKEIAPQYDRTDLALLEHFFFST